MGAVRAKSAQFNGEPFASFIQMSMLCGEQGVGGRRDLPNLQLASNSSRKVMEAEEDLRQVIGGAAEVSTPCPVVTVSLGSLDAYRSAWLPANLSQAQRDYFGAPTYERIDAKGTFYTEWDKVD